jgi:hypothetical protein
MDGYFKNGYHIDRYYALEEDLLIFLNYITLEFYPKPQNRSYIKSIYLSDLILRIGSNISTFFDRFIDNYPFSGGNILFWTSDYQTVIDDLREKKKKSALYWGDYKKLEPILNLTNEYVILNPLNEKLYPFKDTRTGNRSWIDIKPGELVFWWNSYNAVKHNARLEDANLNNVLHALAALLLLITRPELISSGKFERYNYVKKEATFELGENAFGEKEIVKSGYIHEFSTRLFKLGSSIKWVSR